LTKRSGNGVPEGGVESTWYMRIGTAVSRPRPVGARKRDADLESFELGVPCDTLSLGEPAAADEPG
jgi:hypothetical protein